ncbi:MAG: hypothetical protein ACP5P3_09780 [Ignavibacteria bacterium]
MRFSLVNIVLFFIVIISSCKQTPFQQIISGNSADSSQLPTDKVFLKNRLPEDFPRYIPIYEKLKLKGSIYSNEGSVILFETESKIRDVIQYYDEKLTGEGFERGEGNDKLIFDDGAMVGWRKNNIQIGIMLGVNKERNLTSVILIYKK